MISKLRFSMILTGAIAGGHGLHAATTVVDHKLNASVGHTNTLSSLLWPKTFHSPRTNDIVLWVVESDREILVLEEQIQPRSSGFVNIYSVHDNFIIQNKALKQNAIDFVTISSSDKFYIEAVHLIHNIQKIAPTVKDGVKIGFGDLTIKRDNVKILAAVLMPPKEETPDDVDWEKLVQAKLLLTVKF